MSLDALAPDQRAVVQLVLQQDRSYGDLAGLLGISEDAVRQRAHRGLDRLAAADGLDDDARGDLADYLLGQAPAAGEEGARALLESSPAARAWARAVSAELAGIARTPLPQVPDEAPESDEDIEDFEDEEPADEEPVAQEPADDASETRRAAPVRARPRPRPAPAPRGTAQAAPRALRSNRLGGALLIGGGALLLVVLVVFLVTRGGDDGGDKSAAKTGATPTATATPEFKLLGGIQLTSPTGGKAKGEMAIFASEEGGIAFTVTGTDVPANGTGAAYAVWLTGGDASHRLGYAPAVGDDGKLGTSGPRKDDVENFAKWFARAKKVVVSRETNEDATEPGPVVLEGKVPSAKSGPSTG